MKQSPAYNLPIAAVPRKAKRPAQQRKGPVPRHMEPQPRTEKQQARPHREPLRHRVPALLRRATLRKAKQHYKGLPRHTVLLQHRAQPGR
jgi:hypothetical protein